MEGYARHVRRSNLFSPECAALQPFCA